MAGGNAMKSKLLLQLILIALFFTSCYDKDRTLYYETNGEKINIFLRILKGNHTLCLKVAMLLS